MAFKIACVVLSLAVAGYGYPSGFDDFGNIGKEFGNALSEAQEGVSKGLSDTKDALNQAGKETSDALNEAKNDINSDPGMKDAMDLFGGFGKALSSSDTKDRSERRTTPKSIFDEDQNSGFGRNGGFGSSDFGSSSFGSSSFGGNGFGSDRRDPFGSSFGSSFGQSGFNSRPGFGQSGFGSDGFGSHGGFGGGSGFGNSGFGNSGFGQGNGGFGQGGFGGYDRGYGSRY